MKICSKCKIEQDILCFGKLNSSSDGYRYDCKKCRKEYNQENKDKIKANNHKYYFENKDKILNCNKIYRLTNKDKILEQRKEYRNREEIIKHNKEKMKEYLPIRKTNMKQRRLFDLNFRLSEALRSKLHRGIKGYNTSLTNILGCDMTFFKKWIEFRFDYNMNWNNYGKEWHIDHILPINQFNFKNQNDLNICFHWTNLQPLNAKDNQSKSDNIILHYYFNNMINVFRFNKHYKQYLGYQTVNESLQWLRSKLRYGKNSLYEGNNMPEIDNPQPSL